MIAEVAQKYILGKTGGLLPYEEFKKVRPDVSRAEYKAYQADKFDNSEDWNPFDGDVSLVGGAVKANIDGIHGAEVSMLGRSLPVNTGVIPLPQLLLVLHWVDVTDTDNIRKVLWVHWLVDLVVTLLVKLSVL